MLCLDIDTTYTIHTAKLSPHQKEPGEGWTFVTQLSLCLWTRQTQNPACCLSTKLDGLLALITIIPFGILKCIVSRIPYIPQFL